MNKKKPQRRQQKHKKPTNKREFTKTKSIRIQDIDMSLVNKGTYTILGIVERIAQTAGPTIFHINDGTGTLTSTAFTKAGQRSFPEISENQAVKVTLTIEEFKGEIEGEIKDIKQLSQEEQEKFKKNIEETQEKRAQVKEIPPLVNDPILNKLMPRMIKAAFEIRKAIIQNRPIIVRHHNDTDGYCSGYVLERAILPLIEREHESTKAEWEFFLRAPSAAPYYEIEDSIRDTAQSLRNAAKFSNKLPLIIITDNGSTPEDLFAIKQGRAHGIEFIVIDHHYFDEDVISNETLVHINPYLVGEEGSKYSAGMLCTELSRLINPVTNIEQIPALAGFADKIDLENPNTMQEYLKIAEKQGYTKELLIDLSLIIDFVSAKVRFMEVREYMEGIFGEPRQRQQKLIQLMAPYIKELDKKGLEIAKTNLKTETINNTLIQSINIEETFPGFGFYPKPGRCVSLTHDNAIKQNKNLITVGYSSTSMTIRASDQANFSVHELINYLNKKLPSSFVEGGGHKNAGSINFIPQKKQEILTLFKEFLRKK